MKYRLSVVVPCYNEEKRLSEGFNHYYSYLKTRNYPWELILVNDGSRDKTPEIMQNLAKNKANVNIITYPKNRGKGFAISRGMLNARGKFVLFTDIDHSVDISTIQEFFRYFDTGYKTVIASRRVPGSKFITRQPILREFLGRGFTFLVNLLIYWGVKDATCGFKAFENKTAKKIFKKISIYDWAFDAEIIFICKKLKIKFAQAPVAWKDVRGSKVALKKDILKSLWGVVKIRLNDLYGKYN